MIKLGYVIFYIKNISAAITFYEKAFDIDVKFLHESGAYVEFDTGQTTFALVSDEHASLNVPTAYYKNGLSAPPAGCQLAFITQDVQATFHSALAAGAIKISDPEPKPWGQVVAYVRDPEGILLEIGSEIKT